MANSTTKRKEKSTVSIKRRLSAALVMLLISTVMLVTSTYAWFTLSTAPEVRGIDTSVVGNGSLEIALMPSTGLFSDIESGRGDSGTYAGGTKLPADANITWGNIVNLNDAAYGLEDVWLKPAKLNAVMANNEAFVTVTVGEGASAYTSYVNADGDPIQDNEGNYIQKANSEEFYTIDDAKKVITQVPTGALGEHIFSVPEFGFDGRIVDLINTDLKSYNSESGEYTGTGYGVRVIVDEDGETYGYVIDLALRLNAVNKSEDTVSNGKLLLQVEDAQRVYTDSSSDITRGNGSNLWFKNDQGENVEGDDQNVASQYLKAIRVAFVQNLGNAQNVGNARVLSYARANLSTGDLYLCDYSGNPTNSTVILDSMAKNTSYQISAIVWLDGEAVTNANMAVSNDVLDKAVFNLQFATDITLVPAQNTDLKENPPAAVTENNTPATPDTTPATPDTTPTTDEP